MSLTAAAGGFVVFLLSVSVIQGQKGWGVTYTSTEICAVKGSTVEIHCIYRYPSRINGPDTKVEKAFWFIEKKNVENVYLKDDPQYSGRVQYDRDEIKNDSTLRITDLRESDSAVYKFRFITNQDGKYTGEPGVTLSVADLDLKVSRSSSSSSSLQCHSSRYLPDHTSYIWYKNGQKIQEDTSPYVYFSYDSADSYSCAVKGCENFPSLSVYAPKLPSVSVSPSAEIVEGSSVTLTCSSDANPAAKYTWHKRNGNLFHHPQRQKPQLVLSSIQSSDSGEYDCKALNELGWSTSNYILDVKYAPKLPSVSVSPSAEIVEGSSVTLTCSSDANPAANYTWYKEDEDSPKASGQIFTITNVTAEHSGNYYCEAQNTRGRHNSTLHLTVVADRSSSGAGKLVAAGTITVVLLAVILLAVFLWIRKKRASRDSSEPGERADNREQRQPEEQGDLQYASIRFSNQADPLYYNMRPAQPLRHTEQREDVEYVTVKFNSARTAPRTRGRGGGEDPAALYSTVNKSR